MVFQKPPRLQRRTNDRSCDSKWIIRYWEIDPKTGKEKRRVHVIPSSFQSKQRAESYLAEFTKRYYNHSPDEQMEYPIGTIINEYLVVIRREKEFKTFDRYNRALERFLTVVDPSADIHQITREDIMVFRNLLIEQLKLMPRTVNGDLAPISTFFNWVIAQEKYGLKRSPYQNIPKMKEKPRPFTIFTHQHIREIRRQTSGKRKDSSSLGYVYTFLAMTGMRQGEICHMVWDWVADDMSYISIQPVNLDYRDRHYSFNPKGNQIRRIPTTKAMRFILRCQRKVCSDDCPFVFTFANGSPIDDHLSNRFTALMKKLKYEDKFARRPSLHDLRHTCASRLIRAGVDIALVMKFMGWENLETAQNYIHAFGNLDEASMRKVWTKSGR